MLCFKENMTQSEKEGQSDEDMIRELVRAKN